MNIRRISPNISSDEMQKSKEFYTEFLGLKLVMDMHWVLTFASESNPTAQINIVQNTLSNTSARSNISIEVEDVDAVCRKAIALGYKIIYPVTVEPWGVKRFFVEDPNGVVINIMNHVP